MQWRLHSLQVSSHETEHNMFTSAVFTASRSGCPLLLSSEDQRLLQICKPHPYQAALMGQDSQAELTAVCRAHRPALLCWLTAAGRLHIVSGAYSRQGTSVPALTS